MSDSFPARRKSREIINETEEFPTILSDEPFDFDFKSKSGSESNVSSMSDGFTIEREFLQHLGRPKLVAIEEEKDEVPVKDPTKPQLELLKKLEAIMDPRDHPAQESAPQSGSFTEQRPRATSDQSPSGRPQAQ